jgi:inner membrane protein
MDDPRIAATAARDPNVRAFLFWSRMPFAERQPDGSLMIWDQRFGHDVARGQFSARIPAEADAE